jgi:hypothetical protein
MNAILRTCLADLEARIDPQVEDRLWREWEDFSNDRFHGTLFMPRRARTAPPQVEWPEVSINAGLADMDMMALQQYGACSQQLAEGTGMLMNVRCNYGTSIIPLLFGVELFVMDEEANTLPTSRPLHNIGAIERLVDAGVPEIRQHYMAQVLEMGAYYAEIAAQYPKIGQYVQIYHPDLQGPMDIVEVVWGSSVFYSLYDRPELVKGLLEVVAETYIACMRAWTGVVPYRQGGNAHWGLYHKGNIMLRDDSRCSTSSSAPTTSACSTPLAAGRSISAARATTMRLPWPRCGTCTRSTCPSPSTMTWSGSTRTLSTTGVRSSACARTQARPRSPAGATCTGRCTAH